MLRTIGLMSGTSLDGVDAAWVETDGVRIGHIGPRLTVSYDDGFRRALRAILDAAPGLAPDDAGLQAVVTRLTEYHADAVARLGQAADLIGFHGQTILHRPAQRRTWQIGDASLLARQTGLPVAYDFRSADIEAGGQGAPLAPAYHAALAVALPKPLVVLNVGGVANVTWIGADGELVAFDTGPGNGLLDDWIRARTGAAFDADGELALAGRVDDAVLERLLAHPYVSQPYPKSLDRLDFTRAMSTSGIESLSIADGAATLVAFTAEAAASAALPRRPLRWLVSGGGRRNPAIMHALARSCARRSEPVELVEAVGWDGDALEAQCFGFLAARVAAGISLSFPSTTGVRAPMGGGRIALPLDH